jgi:hypothetical protein
VCLPFPIVARQRLGKHVPAVKNPHATITKPLDAVFSMLSGSYQILNMQWKESRRARERERESVCVCVCARVCACGGEGQLVSECPLESPPVEGEWPVIIRPLLSLKRRPHFKTRKSIGNKWSWDPKQGLIVLVTFIRPTDRKAGDYFFQEGLLLYNISGPYIHRR